MYTINTQKRVEPEVDGSVLRPLGLLNNEYTTQYSTQLHTYHICKTWDLTSTMQYVHFF